MAITDATSKRIPLAYSNFMNSLIAMLSALGLFYFGTLLGEREG